jgi:hypothetical protein
MFLLQLPMILKTNCHMCTVVGFLGVPTAGWRSAPAYSPRGSTREVLGDGAESMLRQGLKNTRFRVVRAAGA